MTDTVIAPTAPSQVLVRLVEELDAEAGQGRQGSVSSGIVRGVLDPTRASKADRAAAVEVLSEFVETMTHDEDPYAQMFTEYRDHLVSLDA